jgi:hypothetical protein
MDNQYNYYNPNENSNNEDRQRMNSQSEGSQNGEQKGNTPQWQPGGDHLKKEKKPHKNLMRTVAVVGLLFYSVLFQVGFSLQQRWLETGCLGCLTLQNLQPHLLIR